MYLEFVVADSQEEETKPAAYFLYHDINFPIGHQFYFMPVLMQVSEKIDEIGGVDVYRFIGDREPFLREDGFHAVLDRYFWHLSQSKPLLIRGTEVSYMRGVIDEILARQEFAINYLDKAMSGNEFWETRRQ